MSAPPAPPAAAAVKDVYEYIPEPKPAPGTTGVPNVPSSGLGYTLRGAGAREKDRDKEELDVASLKPEKAYETFKGKKYEVTIPQAGAMGTFLRQQPRSEYESVGGLGGALKDFETPLQRTQRLQAEVSELLEYVTNEINLGRGNELRALFEGAGDPAAIKEELKTLEGQLSTLLNDEKVKAELIGSSDPSYKLPAGEADLFNSVMQQLSALKTTSAATADKDKEKKKDGESRMVYEVYYDPNERPLVETSKLIGLESRLSELEKQIGVEAQSQLPFPDVQSGIYDLNERLSLLDANKLDAIGRRTQALMSELEMVLRKKAEITSAALTDDDQKVQELFLMSQRWKIATAGLPYIVVRLKSLKALHQHSGSFATRISVLESNQTELQKQLDATSAALTTVSKSLQDSLKTFTENIDKMHTRIAELQKKK
ncbi:unnamed protein product [Vitrella brassicaformis CCMP3155]|uniref:Dynactin subunit 2 n=1 Tax=Vitrella brassicaformis (strain CCMP3155) TaxID=1169540 RepID=A0A0G4FBR7_VITBC|nr:unnamed protein product [Vitrella brassicaformis CCMP3155]|mmetsp:Transcript_43259/g.108081  ORF Transcript_43259/g.108081 Transcript_43259/m.108081 type:complete len:429 (-) Transcript_43259:393-1679(-)|eukprot:CEM10075.1 unnamed protein product [Vitrella brassicaformis CCMP3155]